MTPLHKLFGRDDTFYDLLDASAAEVERSISQLLELVTRLNDGAPASTLGDLSESRRRHKRLRLETTEKLFRNSVSSIEREDVESISYAFYRITKTAEKIAERLIISPPGVNPDLILKQASLLREATPVLAKMTADLRHKNRMEAIREGHDRLLAIEGDADRVMGELLRDLYHGQADARAIVFSKDIYEMLEKAIDRCRDAGGLIFQVVLKSN